MNALVRAFVILSLIPSALEAAEENWQPLVDRNLTQWEVWTGSPDRSLEVALAAKKGGRPLGKGDPLGIYSAEKQPDGSFNLIVSGKAPAALTTKETYSKYHLRADVKWGEKKWPPKLSSPRDSGILYHCQGEDGTFWGAWKTGMEYQIQECEFGGYFKIGDVKVEGRVENPSIRRPRYKATSPWATIEAPTYCNRCDADYEKRGDWNTVELIVAGNRAVHIINGQVVNILRRAQIRGKDGRWSVLREGQIQIQSAGAEVTFRGLEMRKIPGIPAKYLKYFRGENITSSQ